MAAMTQQVIKSGVELTAVFIAASRAIETGRPDRLITDPYAASFVRAARDAGAFSGVGFSPDDEIAQIMATFAGLRSRFFDAYLTSRVTGARQVVLIAAGLDARAYRLAWPAGTTVYEIDKPNMFDFKDAVLAADGAVPACTRRTVGVDLRDDWVSALGEAGFDPGQPTLWLIEGLLMYLPAVAQDALLDTILRLSAPGSALAADYIPDVPALLSHEEFIAESSKSEGFDAKKMFNAEPKEDPAIRLGRLGWVTSSVTSLEVAQAHGRKLQPLFEITAHYSHYLIAELPSLS